MKLSRDKKDTILAVLFLTVGFSFIPDVIVAIKSGNTILAITSLLSSISMVLIACAFYLHKKKKKNQ